MRYRKPILKTGLFWINFSIVLIGFIISLVTYESYSFKPVIISAGLGAFLNVLIGATNTEKNVESRFRRWLFGD